MSDIVERLKKAARDFEGIRDHEGNMEDSDCEPHWSNYREMDDAGQSAIEGAAEIVRLRAELEELSIPAEILKAKVRRETIEESVNAVKGSNAPDMYVMLGPIGVLARAVAAIRALGEKTC